MTGPLDLRQFIRSIPDFPKPGIMFRDITPLLANPHALRESVRQLAEGFRELRIDKIMAAEARGFIFAAPLAMELEAGFVPVRKHGKLPYDTRAYHYDLEYGSDTLEIHSDALETGDRVLMIDDLLATGGTVKACIELAEQSEAEVVGCGFLVELNFLRGRDHLGNRQIVSLIQYADEKP